MAAPRATPIPLPKRAAAEAGEPLRLRVSEQELARRRHRQDRRLAIPGDASGSQEPNLALRDGEIVLGPFYKRGKDDVAKLRREIGLESEDFASGRAVRNARSWLSRRNALVEEGAGSQVRGDRLRRIRRQDDEQNRCYVGNDELSCYPTDGTKVLQGQWGKLVWNTYYPEFTNRANGHIDIYLFHQDSDKVFTSWTSVPNSQGRLSFQPGDSWWEGREKADNFNGTDVDWPFYFVITYAGAGLGGTTHRLSTWYAVQTALPEAIAESRLSESLAHTTPTTPPPVAPHKGTPAETSSVASSLTSMLIDELHKEGFYGTQTLQSTTTTTLPNGAVITASATAHANGKLPPGGEEHGLPTYAIVLIALFGFLALVAIIVGLYFGMAAARRRRWRENAPESMNSDSNAPMMADYPSPEKATSPESPGPDDQGGLGESVTPREVVSEPTSPGFAGYGAGGFAAGFAAATRRTRSMVRRRPLSMPMMESPGETSDEMREEHLTSNEASRLAAAFRAVLRRPAFTSLSAVRSTATTPPSGGPTSGLLSRVPSQGVRGAGGNDAERVGDGLALSPTPETPLDVPGDSSGQISVSDDPAATALLQEELTSEGRSMRRIEQRRPEVHESTEHLPRTEM